MEGQGQGHSVRWTANASPSPAWLSKFVVLIRDGSRLWFVVVSDLVVCPNALPLAALHRTNSRTLTMFTRFYLLTTYPRLTGWHPIRLLA